jgi:branched-chain amino acid transport system ATP-binding protein
LADSVPADQDTLLSVRGVSAGYGLGDVIREVSFDVATGDIVAVIGPNGAGKSTLLRTISGVNRARTGHIRLRDADITRTAVSRRVCLGLGHVPEGRRILGDLTVRENLWLGGYTNPDRRGEMEVELLSLFPRLAERLGQRGGTLSGGEQQMLALARGMMSKPALLMIDEPTLGLSPVLVGALATWLVTLRDRFGTTIILAEQNARLARSISEKTVVLGAGRVLTVSRSAALSDEDLVSLFLTGRKLETRVNTGKSQTETT